MKTFENPIERMMEYEIYSERLLTLDEKNNKHSYGYFGNIQKSINNGIKVKKRIRKK